MRFKLWLVFFCGQYFWQWMALWSHCPVSFWLNSFRTIQLSAMLILLNFNVYYFLFYCRSSISYRCRQVFHATLIKTKITWWCLPNSPQKFKNSANIKGQWAGAIVGAPVIVIKIFPLRTIASRTADKPLSGLRGLGLHPDWKGAVIIN